MRYFCCGEVAICRRGCAIAGRPVPVSRTVLTVTPSGYAIGRGARVFRAYSFIAGRGTRVSGGCSLVASLRFPVVIFGYEVAVLGHGVAPLTALVSLTAIVVGAGVVGTLPVHERPTIPVR